MFFFEISGSSGLLHCSEHLHDRKRACPGAEVLCSKIIARSFLDIVIEHTRVDGPAVAFSIYVLKQFFAGNVPASLHYFRQALAADSNVVINTLFFL